MTSKDLLIVLGSSLTALAVVRDAHSLGLATAVVDGRRGTAGLSRLPERIAIVEGPDDAWLGTIADLAADRRTYLIATSDEWLQFIVRHRGQLSARTTILHGPDEALSICLSKDRFSAWCHQHGFHVPRRFDIANVTAGVDSWDTFPLLLRPGQTFGQRRSLPKTVEVADRQALGHWLARFQEAGVEPAISESLLGDDLTQYSVGAARQGGRSISFVAVKRRPLPRQCAVGTYVELSPDPQVEALALRVLDALDYQGIAEVEILRSRERGRDYVIEVNARPWIQYSLGPASGHPLLGFLLDPSQHDAAHERKTGLRWMDWGADAFVCFSRSMGVVRNGDLGVGQYLYSVLRANVYARFAWGDLKPWRQDLLARLGKPR